MRSGETLLAAQSTQKENSPRIQTNLKFSSLLIPVRSESVGGVYRGNILNLEKFGWWHSSCTGKNSQNCNSALSPPLKYEENHSATDAFSYIVSHFCIWRRNGKL